MKLTDLVRERIVLAEGSIYELLRRDGRVQFDPLIAHAGLIYESFSREILGDIHRRYIDVAARRGMPIVTFTDTWRASGPRVAASRFRGKNVNRDNVAFLREVAARERSGVLVGGLTGPARDAYNPAEALSHEEAIRYHAEQVQELAGSGVDLLMAATLPSFQEASAIADVLSRSGVPWMLSFVVRDSGVLLDGTRLEKAIDEIDSTVTVPAIGYSINCVHPDVARMALSTLQPRTVARVLAFQGNTSALPPEELDGSAELESAEPDAFAASVLELMQGSPLRIVGGCCGTDPRHMEALAHDLSRL